MEKNAFTPQPVTSWFRLDLVRGAAKTWLGKPQVSPEIASAAAAAAGEVEMEFC